ncbi:MAG: hypothetical protein LBK60_03690 [Verrucomicrobiales bacterium]|jgi:hypothetical protein|nr:hypothetical protein [Verrucomicrobiales bacterium]
MDAGRVIVNLLGEDFLDVVQDFLLAADAGVGDQRRDDLCLPRYCSRLRISILTYFRWRFLADYIVCTDLKKAQPEFLELAARIIYPKDVMDYRKITGRPDIAILLGKLASVQYWLRNMARHPASFRLPTSADFFYPDFVM